MLSPGEHWLLLSTTNTGHQPVVNATGHQTKVFTTARDDLWWWDWYQIKVIWILESKSKNSFHHQHQMHCYWTRVAHTHWWRHNIIFGSHLEFGYNILAEYIVTLFITTVFHVRGKSLMMSTFRRSENKVMARAYLRSHTLGGRIEDMTDGCPVIGLCARADYWFNPSNASFFGQTSARDVISYSAQFATLCRTLNQILCCHRQCNGMLLSTAIIAKTSIQWKFS